MLEDLTQSTFSDQLNTTFCVRLPDQRTVELLLAEVTSGPPILVWNNSLCFSTPGK